MTFLDINIQLGKFVSNGNSGTNWLSLISIFLSSLLSFCIALTLYLIKNNYDKQQDTLKKKKESDKDLKYFNIVVRDILNKMPTQINAYKKYSEALNKAPYLSHPLHAVSIKNLYRIVNTFDQQKIFHSFILQFDEKHNDEIIESFMKLYHSLDVYLTLFNEAEVIYNALNEHTSNQINNEYLEVFGNKIIPNFENLIEELRDSNISLYQKLSTIKSDYSNVKIKSINISQEYFVEKLLNNYEVLRVYPIGKDILNDCNWIKSVYSSIVRNANRQVKKITYISNNLEKILKTMTDIIDRHTLLINESKIKQ
jgi:hypothetical protein